MPKGVLVVFSDAVSPEREEDFNRWYDQVHVPEVTSVPGCVAARRYVFSPPGLDPVPTKHRYLALYEFDAPQLQPVVDEIYTRFTEGRFDMGDSIDLEKNAPITLLYESLPGPGDGS